MLQCCGWSLVAGMWCLHVELQSIVVVINLRQGPKPQQKTTKSKKGKAFIVKQNGPSFPLGMTILLCIRELCNLCAS